MPRKTNPTGYVARCQCGSVLGCLDFERAEPQHASELLTQWLRGGLTIEPRWGSWSEKLQICRCDYKEKECV